MYRMQLTYILTLLCQLCWSKNVQEERDMPFQILLGSADNCYCILLTLGLYLELWIASREGLHSQHVFVAQNETPAQVNKACYSAIKMYAFNAEDFVRADDAWPIDTHSLHKLPATFARHNNDRGTWLMASTKQMCKHAICQHDIALPGC